MQRLLLDIRRHRRGITDLFVLALFGAVGLILALSESSFYLIFAPFAPRIVYEVFRAVSGEVGELTLLTVGIFLALCLAALWFFLWYYARRSRRALGLAAALYALDTLGLALFSFRTSYAYGMADTLFHLLALVSLLRALAAARRIETAPAPEAAELAAMLTSLAPLPPELSPGDAVGDAPADVADTVPLREAVPRRRVLFARQHEGLSILVTRSYGLTELTVNGKVYAEVRGVIELAYTLSATVEGHRITVRFHPGAFFATMLLIVDGCLVAVLRRYH